MRVIAVRWAELETAVERNAPDTESFLDTRTGEVITLVESAPNVQELRSINKVECPYHDLTPYCVDEPDESSVLRMFAKLSGKLLSVSVR